MVHESILKRRKITFLIVAPVYIDGNIGCSAHLRGVVTGLSSKHNVYLIAKSIDPNFDKFNFQRVHSKDEVFFLINYFLSYFNLIYLCLYNLIFRKIDVIYERDTIFVACSILGKIFHKKTILEMNGLNNEIDMIKNRNVQSKYQYIRALFINSLTIININMATCILVGSSKLKHVLMDEYKIDENKICMIENGVDTVMFKPIEKAKDILHINGDYFYIGFVGTLEEWQGIENIIDAASHVIQKIPHAHFLIVGGKSNTKNRYQNLAKEKGISDNFTFFGEVPYTNIPLYINSFDVCITLKMELKSGYSPAKLYEYMACGKPIVASNTHGHMVLNEYNAGILVNSNDPYEVSEAIIKLYNSKSYREELGNNGIKLIKEKYSWERVADNIEELCLSKL